ncbi:hypothetical protein WA158_004392 [Blastocystis sp. Blastoise]
MQIPETKQVETIDIDQQDDSNEQNSERASEEMEVRRSCPHCSKSVRIALWSLLSVCLIAVIISGIWYIVYLYSLRAPSYTEWYESPYSFCGALSRNYFEHTQMILFQYYDIDVEGMKQISSCLYSNPISNLNYINFIDNPIGDDGFLSFIPLLSDSKLPYLDTIFFMNNGITSKSIPNFVNTLIFHKISLSKLSFSWNSLGYEGISSLSTYFQSTFSSNLTSFDCLNCNITDATVNLFISLFQNTTILPNLKYFTIEDNPYNSTLQTSLNEALKTDNIRPIIIFSSLS